MSSTHSRTAARVRRSKSMSQANGIPSTPNKTQSSEHTSRFVHSCKICNYKKTQARNLTGFETQLSVQKSGALSTFQHELVGAKAMLLLGLKCRYNQLPPSGHPAITHTPIIRTAAKSPAKKKKTTTTTTNYRRLTELKLTLLRTLANKDTYSRSRGKGGQ